MDMQKLFGAYGGVISDILSGRLCGVNSDTLSGILSGINFNIISGILSSILSDILSTCVQTFCLASILAFYLPSYPDILFRHSRIFSDVGTAGPQPRAPDLWSGS